MWALSTVCCARGAPGSLGRFVVGEDTDDIEILEIAEIQPFQRLELAAEYEMEKLPFRTVLGHGACLRSWRGDSRLGLPKACAKGCRGVRAIF